MKLDDLPFELVNISTNYPCWNPGNNTIVRNIFNNNCIYTYNHEIPDCNPPQDSRACTYVNVVSYLWDAATIYTPSNRNALSKHAIVTYHGFFMNNHTDSAIGKCRVITDFSSVRNERVMNSIVVSGKKIGKSNKYEVVR